MNQFKNKFYLLTIILVVISSFNNCATSQNSTLKSMGDALLILLPTTAYTTTIIKKDREGRNQFYKSFALNLAVTSILKYSIKKQRPDLSNSNSFPSGHASTTFQSAAFLQRRYGSKFGVPAFILAGFTGYSRIASDKHDLWDVLAGAIIGTGSSFLFTTKNQRKHLNITYSGLKNNHLIGVTYLF